MSLSLIVCCDLEGGIGKEGGIPWKNSYDLRNFKNKTENNIVVMARGTWDSLPKKPLLNRINVVLTRQNDLDRDEDIVVAKSFESLDVILKSLEKIHPEKEIFIIGGSTLYEYVLKEKMIKKIYLTIQSGHYGCDRFVHLNLKDRTWRMEKEGHHPEYSYYEYSKIV